ncbi:hypothetical protein V5799_032521 [Amblyomma americanum]|uniref:Zinc finger RING-type eukaryotic domain-containing protein n=1 Tax=Amblyomma americanum TaxID=6943 RepID=A0AAQ4DQY0_AMBAM
MDRFDDTSSNSEESADKLSEYASSVGVHSHFDEAAFLVQRPGRKHILWGYDSFIDYRPITFVDPLPEHRVCFLCFEVPPFLWMIPCGHVMCRNCVTFDTQVVDSAATAMAICLKDNTEYTTADVQRLDFNAKELGTLRVYCPNLENGCTHSSELRHLESHYPRHCLHEPTSCTRGLSRDGILICNFAWHRYRSIGRKLALWFSQYPQEAGSDVVGDDALVPPSQHGAAANATPGEMSRPSEAPLAGVIARSAKVDPELVGIYSLTELLLNTATSSSPLLSSTPSVSYVLRKIGG